MSGKRKGQHRKNCLLAFIEDCLNDSSLNHLIRWSDKPNEIFQVLWVHAGRSNYYRKTQGCLFDLYREYRGRGMTSDPKQAFRMALKKSPCIKSVKISNIQEDWRTFQIVLKCHKNISGETECSSWQMEKKYSEMQNFDDTNNIRLKPLLRDSNLCTEERKDLLFDKKKMDEVHCSIRSIHNISDRNFQNYPKYSLIKNNASIDIHNLQEKYICDYFQNEKLYNSQLKDPNVINDQETNSFEGGAVHCNNTCCKYSTHSEKMAYDSTMLSSSMFSLRTTQTIAPSIVNDSPTRNFSSNLSNNYLAKPNETQQPETENLPFDSLAGNWNSNKINCTQCSLKENGAAKSYDYPSSNISQSTFEYAYNDQSTGSQKYNDPSTGSQKGFQSYDQQGIQSYKPNDELTLKGYCLSDYHALSQENDQNICFPYSYFNQDLSHENIHSNTFWNINESQQLVQCNY